MSELSFSVSGKVALVTGASGGLGEHFARVLAANGATVALCARRADQLERVSNELREAGANTLPVTLDVCSPDSVASAMSTIESELGTPDILINNAGVAQTQRFLEITEEAWQRIIDVNLTGVFRVGQAVARSMAARGTGGSIINIASLLAFVVQPTQAAYASSKAGVVHLTESMACELGREKIRVNAIAPGYFVTEMNRPFFEGERGKVLAKSLFPRRTGELRELDGALLLLASEAGSYMTGETITVDGGTRLGGV